MEVILSQDIKAIGKAGDVVKVKDGFARNYLLPRKAAYLATPANLKKIEQQKVKRAAQEQEEQTKAQETAEKISKVSCNVSVEVNDLEKLYGSVTQADIIKSLAQEGYEVDKNDVLLDKPIEELGIYEVNVRLHPKVIAKVRVWVTKK